MSEMDATLNKISYGLDGSATVEFLYEGLKTRIELDPKRQIGVVYVKDSGVWEAVDDDPEKEAAACAIALWLVLMEGVERHV